MRLGVGRPTVFEQVTVTFMSVFLVLLRSKVKWIQWYYGTEGAIDDLNHKATIYKMQIMAEEHFQLAVKTQRWERERKKAHFDQCCATWLLLKKEKFTVFVGWEENRWSSKCSFSRIGPTTHPDHTSQQCSRHSSEVSKTVTLVEVGGRANQPHGATRTQIHQLCCLPKLKNKQKQNKTAVAGGVVNDVVHRTYGRIKSCPSHTTAGDNTGGGPAIHFFSPDTFLEELPAKVRRTALTARVEASPGRPGTASPGPSMGSFVNKVVNVDARRLEVWADGSELTWGIISGFFF